MNKANGIYQDLLDIGFNMLEAEVYIELLASEPMTAYRIAKKINKPTANVYKAIDALAGKGAVIVEDNKSRICKAVSPDEFIGHFEKSLLHKTNSVKIKLNNLGKTHYDERSYTIDSVDLAFEKFISMLEQCSEIAIIDIFPKPLEIMLPSIKKAIKRGVRVFIQVYEHIDLEGASIAYTPLANNTLDYWQSQQMNLVIDGEQHLLCLINNELTKVLQAKWSNNLYVSSILLGGLMREQIVMKLMNCINDDDFANSARDILNEQRFFFNSKVPGVEKLFKLYSRTNSN